MEFMDNSVDMSKLRNILIATAIVLWQQKNVKANLMLIKDLMKLLVDVYVPIPPPEANVSDEEWIGMI